MIRINYIIIFFFFFYIVNVKAQSCIELTQPNALTLQCSKIDITLNGSNNGEASVIVNGGSSPYQYLWSNGITSSTITNLTSGTYTVTVTDANSCSMTCSSTVNEPICTTPSAGADIMLACNGNLHNTTTQLSAAGTGYSWFVKTQPNGAAASIDNTGLVQNMTIIGDYIFEIRQDNYPNCKDEIKITAPNCVIPCPTNNCGTLSVRKL